MKVTLWGTRGSLASPGPDTIRYGGNTSCVAVQGTQPSPLILDAGTGIRGLGMHLPYDLTCYHILLTHLHMDHLQGLPFFIPMLRPGVDINIYGPASLMYKLEARLDRYISPPLFPVRVRDLLSTLHYHELTMETVEIGEFQVQAQMILHPNPTVGYRIESGNASMTYLPDHEPALGISDFPTRGEWLSGFQLAQGVDLLIHDAQYTAEEYEARNGFGHSSLTQAVQFAVQVEAQHFISFHHDPAHSDDFIDSMMTRMMDTLQPDIEITPGKEGMVFELET